MSHWSLSHQETLGVNVNYTSGIPSKGRRSWCTYTLFPSVTGDCINSLARASAARESPGARMLPVRSQAVGINHVYYGVLTWGPQPTTPPNPRPHSRRWAAGEWVKLHLSLPMAPHHLHYYLKHPSHPPTPPHPGPWKNCLPRNQSLVPKSWGPLF